MHVSLLVGNGFDIQANLKTKYSDFYKYLRETALHSESLNDNTIYKEINKMHTSDKYYEKWSDFEMGLMSLTQEVNDESGLSDEKLFVDKMEIETHLTEYLKSIEQNINVEKEKDKIIEEFSRSASLLFLSLRDLNRDQIGNVLKLNNDVKTMHMNILDFNFTSLFKDSYELMEDNLASVRGPIGNSKLGIPMKKHEYIKVHGSTSRNMNLGGNDSTQLGVKMRDSRYSFSFIKPELDKAIAEKSYIRGKKALQRSSVFFVLGMSLGESDKNWWGEIANQLLRREKSALVIFSYHPDEIITNNGPYHKLEIDRIIDKFSSYFSDSKRDALEKIQQKVFVVINSRLFNLANMDFDEVNE
ncbi:AbiH family protein [Halobacillus salinus]|uniref:AbiH family protein n=1 Tax=Halobacillus salinus TaxID=192814 RepID=UPI0019D60456|nr:AbiH family protein [Halobacillus salinus]